MPWFGTSGLACVRSCDSNARLLGPGCAAELPRGGEVVSTRCRPRQRPCAVQPQQHVLRWPRCSPVRHKILPQLDTASDQIVAVEIAYIGAFAARAEAFLAAFAPPFQRRYQSGDVTAQPFDALALVWRARHRRIQREPVTCDLTPGVASHRSLRPTGRPATKAPGLSRSVARSIGSFAGANGASNFPPAPSTTSKKRSSVLTGCYVCRRPSCFKTAPNSRTMGRPSMAIDRLTARTLSQYATRTGDQPTLDAAL